MSQHILKKNVFGVDKEAKIVNTFIILMPLFVLFLVSDFMMTKNSIIYFLLSQVFIFITGWFPLCGPIC